jgi:hypothetical protein
MRARQHKQEERPAQKGSPYKCPAQSEEGAAMLRPYQGRAYFVCSCFVDSRKT